MPDVTPYIDRSASQIPQQAGELLFFIQEMEEENPYHLSLDALAKEIKNQSLAYVRMGYMAAKVKCCKLWEKAKKGTRFTSFQQWCEIALGRSHWQINRLIEAAQVVVELAQAGFDHLPQNEAQARPLVKLAPEERVEKWQEVIESLPQHRITATAIAEIVGVKSAQSHRIELDADTYELLAKKAADAGMTPKELLKQLIEGDAPSEPDPDPKDFPEPDPDPTDDAPIITRQHLQRWEDDLQVLVNEGDRWGVTSLSNSS